MNESGRKRNTILNLIAGMGTRVAMLVLSFVVRTVFVQTLATEYLGVNGLYGSVLTFLSLAEMGFGVAMVYSMYKPLAEKDNVKLGQLLRLYKRVYAIVGTIVFAVGLALIPVLQYIITDAPDLAWKELVFYYVLFLFDTAVGYWFFGYRNSLYQADQKAYVLSNNSTIFTFIKSILQIIMLVCFKSFTVYLVSQIVCSIGGNLRIAYKTRKDYADVDIKNCGNLPKEEKTKIFDDVKALMLSRIAHVALNASDNIIISAFIGVKFVGLLSNFFMVTEAITGILTQITSALSASLGNYFVKEDKQQGYSLFKKIEFLNFWLYGFSTVAFITLLRPFVTVWLGEKFLLSQTVVIALSINFFVAGFMNTLWTFRSTLGLFTQGKFRPLIVAALNIALSIILSFKLGIAGVLFATAISRACVNLWYDPWIIHKHGFGQSVKPFFIGYVFKIILLVAVTAGMYGLSMVIFAEGVTMLRFIIMVVLTGVLPNLVFLLVFYRTEEFKYFLGFVKGVIKR